MTTLQIRLGSDHSICVSGDDLLYSQQGIFRLDVDGDHLILEPALPYADSAFERPRAALIDGQPVEHGTNVWNGNIPSDRPGNKPYRVNLYQLSDSSIRGTCQCMNWHLEALGHLDLFYRCKHIVSALAQYRNAA